MATETESNTADLDIDESIGIQAARATLGELVTRANYRDERIMLTRKDKPAGAIIGMRDLERLRQLDEAAQPAA